MTASQGLIIFPHQLFRDHPGLIEDLDRVVLIEDGLFFGDHRHPVTFHKQKLWMHRASMKRYESTLKASGVKVEYLDHQPGEDMTRRGIERLASHGVDEVLAADPHDDLLGRRLARHAGEAEVTLFFSVLLEVSAALLSG